MPAVRAQPAAAVPYGRGRVQAGQEPADRGLGRRSARQLRRHALRHAPHRHASAWRTAPATTSCTPRSAFRTDVATWCCRSGRTSATRPTASSIMGGAAGNSPSNCPNTIADGSQACDDNTIAFHAGVSSTEPFYCSPSGGMITQNPQGVDVVTCASAFFGSKGAYATRGRRLVLSAARRPDRVQRQRRRPTPRRSPASTISAPSRARRRSWSSSSIRRFAGARSPTGSTSSRSRCRSRATPTPSTTTATASTIRTAAACDGFNSYGHDFIGQPSVIYSVPITVGRRPTKQTLVELRGLRRVRHDHRLDGPRAARRT